jgi:transposase
MRPATDTTQASWELPEAIWQRMAPVIPPRTSQAGRPQTVDLQRITAGRCSVLRTGSQGQACPRERFGPPSTGYDYCRPGVAAGVFGPVWAEALTV